MIKKFHPVLLMIILITLLLFSCYKNQQQVVNVNTCGVTNPVEDLSWLKDRIDALLTNAQTVRYQYVSQADYRGKTVFIFGNCDPLSLSVFPVINCSNVQLGTVGQIPVDSLKNQRTLWKTQNSLCNF